jgi:PAS domain S-box-containing protein
VSVSVPERPSAKTARGLLPILNRPLNALWEWAGASLVNRLTLSVLLGTTAMLAVVGGSSYLAMRQLLERSIEADLANDVAALGGKFEDQLNQVGRNLMDAAGSPFVVRGLADSIGREAYLVPFLHDHATHTPALLSLVLVDAHGHPVAAGSTIQARDRRLTALILAALASGRPQAEVRNVAGRDVLEVVQPVLFARTRTAGGALIGRLDLDNLFQSVVGVLPPRVFHRLRSGNRDAVPNDWARPAQEPFTLQHRLALTEPLGNLGLVMELGEEREAIFAPLHTVALLYLMSGFVLLALAYLLARLLGERLAAPLITLSRKAAAVSGEGTLSTALEYDGRDEIATLARAINTMVGNLTQERESLERKVWERTEELHSSKVLLDNIVENIPHAIGVRDLRQGGKMVLWNHAAEEIFGIEREAVFAGETSPLELLVVRKTGERDLPPPGGEWDATRSFNHPRENRQVFLQTRVLTLVDPGGNPSHLVMTADDITDRRQVESAIRLDRLRFEILYQMAQMVQASEAAIKDFALEAAVRITGSSLGYLCFLDETETLLSMHTWSGSAMEGCRIENPPRTYRLEETGLWGEAVRQRRPIITNDYAADNPWKKELPEGHVPLIRHMNVPLIDNGRQVLLVGVGNKAGDYDESDVRNLTLLVDGMWHVLQRKATEQSLSRSEKSFRSLSQEFLALLEGIPDRITLLDPKLRIVWSNQEGGDYDLRHRQRAGAERKLCYQLWDEFAEICADCPPVRSFASGRSEQGQVETGDGRTWDIRAIPICSEDGAVVNVIELAQDITDRILAQEQTVRAAHLASLGELSAGVAHEINNPVNGIINYAQLLADRLGEDERGADLAVRILHEGERISAIVRRLLFFARPEKGDRQTVDVVAVLGDALTLAATQLRRDHIDFQVEIESPLPELIADPGQLRQVILNIINNARNALNERFPGVNPEKVLEIKVNRFGSDPERIRLIFVDYGCGIPAHLLDRVMNPFFTTKPIGKGTGLGLSISHGIIAEHGGTLKIESVAGQFTRVRIDLPIRSVGEGTNE